MGKLGTCGADNRTIDVKMDVVVSGIIEYRAGEGAGLKPEGKACGKKKRKGNTAAFN